MKAGPAHELRVGDWVRANFATWPKKAEIIAINWPHFTLKTKDHKGDDMVRTRRYTTIIKKVEPDSPSSVRNDPSWLTWPEKIDAKTKD